jgi:hypothetical protein
VTTFLGYLCLRERSSTWRATNCDWVPELRTTEIRLLTGHASSASTEQNWSLWQHLRKAWTLFCSEVILRDETGQSSIALFAVDKTKRRLPRSFSVTLSVAEDAVGETLNSTNLAMQYISSRRTWYPTVKEASGLIKVKN